MGYKYITSESVIKKITRKDSLFHGSYCVDPYQNCEYDCQYCDSSFEKTVYIKKNITEVLEKELKTIQNGRIIIGSVNDPYQNIEQKQKLTSAILKMIKDHQLSCHILTKSPLVLRDLPLLSDLECMVTLSLSSLNDQVVRIFEPGVPSPSVRLQTVQDLRDHGIHAGVALIPLLPYIVEPEIDSIVQSATKVDAQYLLHKHLELKGDQERHFRNLIKQYYPHLLPKYDALYEDDFRPQETYLQNVQELLQQSCKKYNISDRITL